MEREDPGIYKETLFITYSRYPYKYVSRITFQRRNCYMVRYFNNSNTKNITQVAHSDALFELPDILYTSQGPNSQAVAYFLQSH